MQRRKFACEFKLKAIALVYERGMSVSRELRDLDMHENVLHKWVKEFAVDREQAFPGNGHMKPEQLAIMCLRGNVGKLKAARDTFVSRST